MRKIFKTFMLAAACSALFSGAAMAGGAPATIGGSSSYLPQSAVVVIINRPFVPINSVSELSVQEVTDQIGVLPSTMTSIFAYIEEIERARNNPVVIRAVRQTLTSQGGF